MPRDTFTSRPPPVAGARCGASPGRAQDRLDRRRPGRRRPGTRNGRPGAIARIAASSAGAVAPTTRPTVPPGPPARRQPGDPLVEAAPPGRRSPGPPRPEVLQLRRRPGWTSGTGRRRTDPARSSSGAMASSPRYGLTVTASAPRASNRATAWRAAVEPMSPRLRVGDDRDVGRDACPQPLQGRDPGRAERLEEGEVRLDRGAARAAPPRGRSAANRSTPARSREKPGRQRGRVRVQAEAQDGAGRRACGRPAARDTSAVTVPRITARGWPTAGAADAGGVGRRQQVRRDEPVRPRGGVQARHLGQVDGLGHGPDGARRRAWPGAGRRSGPSTCRYAMRVAGRRPRRAPTRRRRRSPAGAPCRCSRRG